MSLIYRKQHFENKYPYLPKSVVRKRCEGVWFDNDENKINPVKTSFLYLVKFVAIIIIGILLYSHFVSAVITDNIRAYYPMDDSGTKIFNSINSSLNGTAVGTTSVSGVIGNARSLNGTAGNYLNTTWGLPDATQMTLQFWAKSYIATPNSNYRGPFTTKNINGFRMEGGGVGANDNYDFYDGSSRDSTITSAEGQSWNLYTVLLTQTSQQIYLNKTLKYTGSTNLGASWITNLILGYGYENNNIRMWNGTIDEVKIWTRLITSTEINFTYDNEVLGVAYPYTIISYYSITGVCSYNSIPINNATVSLINPTTNAIYGTTITNSSGNYLFSGSTYLLITNQSEWVVSAYYKNSTTYYAKSIWINATVAD